jgi:MFS family permease
MSGAALAGILIAFIGAEAVLLLDAATFCGSALLIRFGLRRVKAAEPRREAAPVSFAAYRGELREGYVFLLRARLLLGVVLMVMVTNGLDQGWSSVLLPVHARENLGGARDLGLLAAVFGGCALLGALLYAAVGHRFRRWVLFTIAFLICGLPRFVVAALVDGTLPLAVTMAAGGLAAGMLNPILTTVMYERIPDELRSRVASAVTAGVLMTMPLGGLAAGYLVEQTGLATALLTLGGLYFLTTLAPAVFPRWREMDAGRESLRGPLDDGPGPPVSSPEPARPAPANAATPPRP